MYVSNSARACQERGRAAWKGGSGGRQWAAYAGGREDPKAVLIEFLCEMLRQNFLVHQRLMPRLFEMMQVPGHKSSLASSPS